MQNRSHLAAVFSILAALLSIGLVHADEGVLPGGQRLEGELRTDGQGRLLFQPRGQKPSLPLSQLDHVRFPSVRLPPARAAAPYRVLLRGGQHLTGELVGLNSDKVQLRTAWSDTLSIPRAAVVAVNHAPGFVTVFVDDFEKELNSWRLAGTPALTTRQHVSGQRSLCFNGQGQAEFTISEPLSAGRAGINFHDRVQAKGLSWQFEAEFADSVGWPTVHVRSDPQAGRYWGELSGPVAAKSHLPRQEGWQRLTMEFNSDTLVLSIDDAILLSCRQPAAGGSLRKVRLSCTARTSE